MWTVALCGGLVLAASRAIGRPDVTVAAGFFTGAYPTGSGALAASEVLIWVVLLVLCLSILRVGLLVEIRSAVEALKERRRRALIVLAAGVLLLSVGVVRHTTSDYTMCCGNLNESRQAIPG